MERQLNYKKVNRKENGMNKVLLIGRFVRDPELKALDSGTLCCNFTLAVERKFKSKNQADADFINCCAFTKTAEFIGKYFEKGKLINVTGRMQTRSWKDSEGNNRYSTEVMVDEASFVPGSNSGSGGSDGSSNKKRNDEKQNGNNSDNGDNEGFEGFEDYGDTDLPF